MVARHIQFMLQRWIFPRFQGIWNRETLRLISDIISAASRPISCHYIPHINPENLYLQRHFILIGVTCRSYMPL